MSSERTQMGKGRPLNLDRTTQRTIRITRDTMEELTECALQLSAKAHRRITLTELASVLLRLTIEEKTQLEILEDVQKHGYPAQGTADKDEKAIN